MIDSNKAVEQLDVLLGEYDSMARSARETDLSDLGTPTLEAMCGRLRSAITRFALPTSSYERQAAEVDRNPSWTRLPVLVGVVRALGADIAAGWLTTIEELIHADTFGDLFEQAGELLDKGYKDAAAVVVGSALEAHLRLLCTKSGLDIEASPGVHKKADVLRADLRKADVYNNLVAQQVLSWLALRNFAAHGKYGDYDKAQVEAMLRDVRAFVTSYPA